MQRYNHPARGRPGHHDPQDRLEDMDTDGVDVEVLYCEVSAFRYFYLMKDGWQEATRAFNDTLDDFASADPKRLVVSYQIPIHDIDVAVAEVERVAALGGKSLQLPVFPAELGFARLLRRALRPAVVARSRRPTCRSAATSASTPRSTTCARRDPTPQKRDHGADGRRCRRPRRSACG